jgi:hypothetical protein
MAYCHNIFPATGKIGDGDGNMNPNIAHYRETHTDAQILKYMWFPQQI